MRDKAHCLLPSPPPSSFSFLGSAFAPLKLLLYQTQKKNTHQKHHQLHRLEKHFSCCQRHALNILSYKTVIHITDENGRPDHLQNQYLPLLHNWTVCQRKNSPSWSMSMLWSCSFTFKRPPSLTWSDSSRFWFTNYQPGILKKENRKITKTFFFFSTLCHNFAYIYKNEIQNQVHSKLL